MTPRAASVFAVFFVAVSAAAGDGAPTVLSLTQSAETKLAAGDATGAASELTKALDLAPRNASLRYERAKCRAKTGDVAGTVEDLRKAAELSPADYPLDLALWRAALETSRKAGGSKAPDVALVQNEVAAIRGKAFKADVPYDRQSPEDFGAMIARSIDRKTPAAKREDLQSGLRRLGLLPEQFDVKRELSGALMSQAAAYYDAKRKKFFNLFPDMPPAFVEATASHELVHALQDQYFDLDKWFAAHAPDRAGGVRDDDRVLALRCVVEGEATFVQFLWQVAQATHVAVGDPSLLRSAARPDSRAKTPADREIEEIIAQAKSERRSLPPESALAKAIDQMDKIDPYVMAPLLAAYVNGANLVAVVQSGGGWAAVDGLFTDPPLTTEQCLHPEKYATRRDLPTPIALPDFPELAAAGWRECDAAIHGELYFRVLLKRLGTKPAAAKTAAAGWDGDIYRAWRQTDGRTAIVLATTWDTAQDAREFFDAYDAALSRKYARLAQEQPGAGPDAFRFTCGDEKLGTGALVLRGLEVFSVEGFPADLREAIVAKLVATKVEHVE